MFQLPRMSRGEGWLQGKKPHWGSRALQDPAKDGEEEESCPLQKPEPQERAQRFPSRQPAPRVAGGRCARCRDPWLVPRALSYERLCTQADLQVSLASPWEPRARCPRSTWAPGPGNSAHHFSETPSGGSALQGDGVCHRGPFGGSHLAICIWTFKVSTRFPTPPGAS